MMRRAGFTLVEVLVGLMVASIVLTAGFAALAYVGDTSRHAEIATVDAMVGAGARSLLVDWLQGARLQAAGNAGTFQGFDAEEGGLASDEIIFPTTARTPLHTRNSVVRLFIDRDPATPERGLVAVLIERLTDVPRAVELVPQADQLDIYYRPDTEEAFEWLPDWIGQSRLPRAVEIVLAPTPGDSLPGLLRLPIRVHLATLR
jgi:prepilin-type N-terminal cleavage/methylation domain-containing protein